MKGRKNNQKKKLILVSLLLIIVTLSLGFAANSRYLEINGIEGNVNPESQDLDVIFDNDQVSTNDLSVVKGIGTGADSSETGAKIVNPTTQGVAPTITGFTSNFTEKGQTVEYKFYVYNQSEYIAFLESAQFTITTGEHKTCVALDPTTTNATTITNACKDITLSLIVDGKTILSTDNATFQSHSIDTNNYKEVTVKIAYDGTTYPLPDGDMKVTFDGIRLLYTTLEQ